MQVRQRPAHHLGNADGCRQRCWRPAALHVHAELQPLRRRLVNVRCSRRRSRRPLTNDATSRVLPDRCEPCPPALQMLVAGLVMRDPYSRVVFCLLSPCVTMPNRMSRGSPRTCNDYVRSGSSAVWRGSRLITCCHQLERSAGSAPRERGVLGSGQRDGHGFGDAQERCQCLVQRGDPR